MEKQLAKTLQKIKENDTNYSVRYGLIIKAMCQAQTIGYKVGFRIDKDDPNMDDRWPIVVIHLPEGQISWHIEPDSIPFDGHSTEKKFKRIDDFSKIHS